VCARKLPIAWRLRARPAAAPTRAFAAKEEPETKKLATPSDSSVLMVWAPPSSCGFCERIWCSGRHGTGFGIFTCPKARSSQVFAPWTHEENQIELASLEHGLPQIAAISREVLLRCLAADDGLDATYARPGALVRKLN
jgi:hypothetical protein